MVASIQSIKDKYLVPRYKIMVDHPGNVYEVGKVLPVDTRFFIPYLGVSNTLEPKIEEATAHFKKYPAIFKPLEWWEDRTLDEMLDVKFIKVVKYEGYWREGDIVIVTDYEVDTKNKKLLRYKIEYNHIATPTHCIPASKEEYDEFKRRK